MLKFQEKVVLITGSGTGIGQAIAKKFAENGASVIILGRRTEPLEETKKILQEIISKVQSNAFVKIFSGVDVSDEKGISDMFDSLASSKINVDVVVNNAGVSGPVTCFANDDLDEFKNTVGIHLTGTFWTSVQALKVMKKGAKIITISTFFEEDSVISHGITKAAENLAKTKGGDPKKLSVTLTNLLTKIKNVAEKIQLNTSKMIADGQFLSQPQVAETVLCLADDEMAKILNGKVIPGDRVFYPVRAHIAGATPSVAQPRFNGKSVVFTIDATDKTDADRVEYLANHVEKNGGKAVCIISENTPKELQDFISGKFHSHVSDLKNPNEVQRWLETASKNMGEIGAVIHITGRVPEFSKLIELSRSQWDDLVDKFINTPATVIQRALEHYVPGGGKDPRLYKNKSGIIITIGPDLPAGTKISGADRAKVEVLWL